MSDVATTASAPTAAPSSTPSAAPAKTSSTPAASKPVTPMSTSDFRSFLRTGKSTPKEDFSAPEVHEDSSDVSADVDTSFESADADTEQYETEPEVTDPAVDGEAPDWSWAEPLAAYRDGIHGVSTPELLQALADGQIPDALMDKLTLTMKDGDDEWTGTVGDLRNSAQMHSNYTKKSQALAQEKKQYESERGELIGYLRSWKEDESGEKGLMGLEKMLGEDGVLRIARKLAERLQRKEELEAAEANGHIPAGTAAIVLERERFARENEELKRANSQREERQTQEQTAEQAKATGAKIWAEGQRQFASLGIKPGPDGKFPAGIVKLFKEELATLWEEGTQPNAQMIRTAAMAAKQRSEEIVRQIQAEQKPAAKPAVRGAAPAGAAAPAARTGTPSVGGKQKPMSTAEFKKQYRIR
jgi:hypothetical protein